LFNKQRTGIDRVELESMATDAFERICVGRSEQDAADSLALMSCYRDGPAAAQFNLDGTRWVTVDRLRLTLHWGGEQSTIALPLDNGCNAVVLRVAWAQLGDRNFLHYFYWTSSGVDVGIHSTHALHWALLEVSQRIIRVATDQEIYRTDDLSYPGAELTPT